MKRIFSLLFLLLCLPTYAQWTPITDPSAGGKIHSLRAKDSTLYASGIGHVWKSSDAGATWVEVGSGLPAIGIVSLGVAPDGSLACGTAKPAAAYRFVGGAWKQAAGLVAPNLKVSAFTVAYGR